jgi:hypothetical protein
MEAHAAADHFIRGNYWQKGHGCSVGCAAESLGLVDKSDHAALAAATGTSERLQCLNDYIFESLPLEKSKEWPVRFVRAGWDDSTNRGRDLALVPAQFTLTIIARLFAQEWVPSKTREMCQPIIDGLTILAAGGLLSPKQIVAGERAARAAKVAGDAWAARAAGAAGVAWAARGARAAGVAKVAWAARDAGVAKVVKVAWAAGAAGGARGARGAGGAGVAGVAWDTWDAWDAWDEEALRQAEDLLRLMSEAPSSK